MGGRGAGFIGRPLGSANIVDPVGAAKWLDAYWVFPAICRGQDGCFKGCTSCGGGGMSWSPAGPWLPAYSFLLAYRLDVGGVMALTSGWLVVW